jgi:opacity protein-like surface antigen
MARRLVLSLVSVLATITASHAADLYRGDAGGSLKDAPVYAPGTWTGFYAGINLGAAAGTSNVSDPYGASLFGDTIRTPGALAGGQIGYNYQMGSLVGGVEAEAGWANLDGSNTCFATSSFGGNAGYFYSSNCKAHVDALGTLTARLGTTLDSGQTLLYAKGGAAWEDISNSATLNALGGTTGSSGYKWGWTAGGGVERALSPHWSIKAEYDYLDFGGRNLTAPSSLYVDLTHGQIGSVPGANASTTENIHEFKVGVNYRFGQDGAAWDEVSVKDARFAPASGWEFEAGARDWYSTGRFQKDMATPSLVSRLTYDGMQANAGELFGRVDTPWNIFVKGNAGLGNILKGHMNDEDWGLFYGLIPYSNTSSPKVSGNLSYANIDIGYDVLRNADYKVGPFVGYGYWNEKMNAYGCGQIANPWSDCVPAQPTSVLGITENDTWQSLRVGLSGETKLTDRIKLNVDAAYLPYVSFGGQDNHWGWTPTKVFPEWSHAGNGVQLEALVSYALTDQFSVGIGARYWAAWTTDAQYTLATQSYCGGPCGNVPAAFKAEREGIFAQASYKVGGSSFEPLK